MSYRFLPHTADIKVEIAAPTLDALLADCVAVVRELVAGSSPVMERRRSELTIASPDAHELVWRLVRALLDLFNTDTFIAARLEIRSCTPTSLVGTLHGDSADPERHEAQPEVKALTRHEFDVRQLPEGWRAELLFDV